MPKKVYNDFTGGLSEADKNAQPNEYYAGAGIDLYRDWHYVKPGFTKSIITLNGNTGSITDIIFDKVNSRAYVIAGARWFGVNASADTQLVNFDGGSTDYIIVGGASLGKGIIHPIRNTSKNTNYVSYALITYNAANNNIARGAMTTTWDNTTDPTYQIKFLANWLTQSTGGYSGGIGASALNAGRRDILAWATYVWVTNGQYVGKIDVNVFPNTFTSFFDLGSGWTSDLLFSIGDLLGIVASKNPQDLVNPTTDRNENSCKVFFIDGSSTTRSTREIPLEGITEVYAVKNLDGVIYMVCDAGEIGHVIGVLGNDGLEQVKKLYHDISGTMTPFLSPLNNSGIAPYRGRILVGAGGIGVGSGTAYIFSYGKRDAKDTYRLTVPFAISSTSGSKVRAITKITTQKTYVAYSDGSNDQLAKIAESGNQTPTFKLPYEDFAQKVRINYVKVYFKTLVSGDSITAGLDVDYGTSLTLGIGSGNIGYGNDGATTYKRFDIKIMCHAFRPTISWVTGGASISKVVVDFDYTDDI